MSEVIDKVGLLLLNRDQTQFLVCRKDPQNITGQWIMPGGVRATAAESDIECLTRKVKEELGTDLIPSTVSFVHQYEDVAAGWTHRRVRVRLHQGKVKGTPKPVGEIIRIQWVGREDWDDSNLSQIIRNKIIPDLLDRGILQWS